MVPGLLGRAQMSMSKKSPSLMGANAGRWVHSAAEVGPRSVGVDADIGAVVQMSPSRRMASLSHLRMLEFGVRARLAGAGPQAIADLLPSLGQNDIDGPLRRNVAGDLLVAQNCLKLADQIGRADDLLAQPARNSTVPASTRETYMMALLGEYCMASVRAPASIASKAAGELLPA